jgi:ubiquinone/menaquinone biosynthesis C-methylase UbiE
MTSADQVRRPGPLGRLIAAAYDLIFSGVEREVFGPRRKRLLAGARGRVLDIGAGTGANLPHYPLGRISGLVLLDPSAGMLARARRRADELGIGPATVVQPAERLPFDDQSFDTIVFTLSLCTIPDAEAALREARRVLRAGGRLLILEHVRSPEGGLARWQDRVTPLWKLLMGGCHANRDTRAMVEAAGFRFESVEEFSEPRIPIPFIRPQLDGLARPAAV